MGRGQVGFSGRHNLENTCNHQIVAVKDYSRRFSFAPGKLKYRQKSANTSILRPGFKRRPLFSLLSTPHHGSFRSRAAGSVMRSLGGKKEVGQGRGDK